MSINQYNYVLNQDTRFNLPTIEEQDECNSRHFIVYNFRDIGTESYLTGVPIKRLPLYFV